MPGRQDFSPRKEGRKMRFHVYQDVRNEWRWYLRSAAGQLATSGVGYARRADCVAAIQRLQASFRHDAIEIVTDNITPLSRMASAGLFASAVARD
jgi:uncharacterized protein YegP (UPF0339 family)